MLKPTRFLIITIVALLVFSCKNNSQDASNATPEIAVSDSLTESMEHRAPKKDLTPQDIAVIKSVMARVMNDGFLKRFSSYLVTAELTAMLSNDPGPFTVFGPTDTAIESLAAEKRDFYANPENRAQLTAMVKAHIVAGNYDKTALLRSVDKSGKAQLKTMAGTTLTITKSGDDLVVSNGKGATATIIKGSLEGSNGSVYVVDAMLGAY